MDEGREAVAARAAVAVVTPLARNSDSAANDTFFAKERIQLGAVVGVLPPGVSAPAIGRSALIPGQPAWAASGLGARQDVTFKAPVWTYQILHWAGRERPFGDREELPGPIDIPVWAEPATGRIIAVDVDRMVAEMQPLFEWARQVWKEEDAPLAPVRTVLRSPKLVKGLLRKVKEEVTDVVGEIKGLNDTGAPPTAHGPRPDDATHPPVEGVGYRSWVTIRGGLVMDAVHPTHVELYVTHRGVPAGRWAAVDAAWEQRAAADARLAAWRTFDVARMSQTGARWEVGG